jgi:hypothetical protein
MIQLLAKLGESTFCFYQRKVPHRGSHIMVISYAVNHRGVENYYSSVMLEN